MHTRTLLLSAILLTACSAKIDRFAVDRVLDRALRTPDIAQACELGVSMEHALTAIPSVDNPPHMAQVIAQVAGAMCGEIDAWEEDLAVERLRHNLGALGEGRADEVTDARLRADRAHRVAARRFQGAWEHAEAVFGPFGEDTCPRIAPRDEIIYVFALLAGTQAVLHDRASGGELGIRLDNLGRVARAAECLDDSKWWGVPNGFQAVVWVTIPGSGPEDIDPWDRLDAAAAAGDEAGIRLSRALQVFAAANAGREDVLHDALETHGDARQERRPPPEWEMFDEYAKRVSGQQLDLLWTRAEGHRAPEFGVLPKDPNDTPPALAEDPFADSDPFAAPPTEDPESEP